MLQLFLFLSIVKSDSLFPSLPNNLSQSNLSPQFISIGQIRLIGLDSGDDLPKLKSDLLLLLYSRFIKMDVIGNDPNIHHQLKANIEILNFTYRDESELENLIPLHFKTNPAHFAIYVIKTKKHFNHYSSNSNIFSKGTNWLAIKFCNDNRKLDIAFQIASHVHIVLSSIFRNPLQVEPKISIANPHISMNVFVPYDYDPQPIIRSAVSDLCTVNLTIYQIDPTILTALCYSTRNPESIANHLKSLPEYLLSEHGGDFPLFILPPKCTNYYASNELAFAIYGMESGLKSVVRKSLFGFENLPQTESFFEIMAQRNMAVFPLKHLVDDISKPIEDINEILLSNGNDENSRTYSRLQKEIDILTPYYKNYTLLQKELASDILDVPIDSEGQEFDQSHNHTTMRGLRSTIAAATEHYQELQKIANNITQEWLLLSEEIVRKRQCVGNLRDLAGNRSVFTRPTFYFALSILVTSLFLAYSSKNIPKNLLEKLFPDPGLP